MMSADLYGIQNSMSVSSPSTMEAESSWNVAYICMLTFSDTCTYAMYIEDL